MPIHFVDEQQDFVVVYKPPDISTHQQGDSLHPALTTLLKTQAPEQNFYPVHRLDKVTSGLLILAKSEQANSEISSLFAQRRVQKIYLALSQRKPSKKQGLVRGDMERSRSGCWKLTRTQASPATTQFFSRGGVAGARLFVLKPHSGKTHQLRVALKSLGAPIWGDQRYGGEAADRCYLHAYALQFEFRGEQYRYAAAPREGEAFLCPSFTEALTAFENPFALAWPDLRLD